MTTKYLTLDNLTSNNQPKQTKFTHYIDSDKMVEKALNRSPNYWDNVLFIGHDKCYGDVFKCWDNGYEDNFIIFFGEKGDEFK